MPHWSEEEVAVRWLERGQWHSEHIASVAEVNASGTCCSPVLLRHNRKVQGPGGGGLRGPWDANYLPSPLREPPANG